MNICAFVIDELKTTVSFYIPVNVPACRTNISLTNVMVDNDCDIDPDYIEFNCSIAYRGNVPPDMQLHMSSIGILVPVKVHAASFLSVVGTAKASRQMKGGQFECQVMGSMVGKQPTCSSQTVSVMCEYDSTTYGHRY